MDPHMTREDEEELLTNGVHRRLQQRLSPPRTTRTKKKKFVNFKVSCKGQSGDRAFGGASHSAGKGEGRGGGDEDENLNPRVDRARNLNEIGNGGHAAEGRENARNSSRGENVRNNNERREASKDVGERRHKRSCNRRRDNAGNGERKDGRSFNGIEMMSCLASPDGEGDESPTSGSPAEEYREPKGLGRTPGASTGGNPKEAIQPATRSPSTASWEKVKLVTVSNGRGARLDSVVEMMVAAGRARPSFAPYIWTPSVPRSSPNPRPANFQDQVEPGKGSYVFSFVSRAPQTRQRQWQKRQLTLPYRQPQSHREWEAGGRQYLKWLKDVVGSPLLQEGRLLKGLEIDVQYPVLHLSYRLPDNYTEGNSEKRRHLETSLGSECNLHQGVYQEVVSWVPELLVTCPSDQSQWARCFIVLGFKTLDGELNQRMEILWKEWTGALYIYCNIDDDLGLKRLGFYRRCSPHRASLFTYLVVVEVDTVTRDNCLHLLDFVYRMRLKSMTGYIAVYQEHYPNGLVEVVPDGGPSSIASQVQDPPSHVDDNTLDLTRITL